MRLYDGLCSATMKIKRGEGESGSQDGMTKEERASKIGGRRFKVAELHD